MANTSLFAATSDHSESDVATAELPLLVHLDETIAADAAVSWDFEAYRWYQGKDSQGVTRTFRFKRGQPLDQWHSLLRAQKLCTLDGPFRTQTAAARPHP